MNGPDTVLSEYFNIRSLFWKEQLARLDAATIKRLVKTLDKTRADITARLLADSSGIASLSEWRKEHDTALARWVDDVTKGAKATISGTVKKAAIASASNALATANDMLSLGGIAKVQNVGLSLAQIESWFGKKAEKSLSEWVSGGFDRGFKATILSTLRKSAIEGKGTSEQVKALLTAATTKGFDISARDASIMARTYTQTAASQAQQAVWNANRRLIKGYERLGTLDNKTCMVCALADGAEYGLDDKRPVLPAHPCCRCLYVPRFKSWRDFGIDVDELEKATRPWTIRNGRNQVKNAGRARGNYENWWRGLSREDQERTAIHGKRAELLRAGVVSWADLWDKATGKVFTLGSLTLPKTPTPIPTPQAPSAPVAPAANVENAVTAEAADKIEEVRNFAELEAQLKKFLSPLAENAGIKSLKINRESYYMATDCDGRLYVSKKSKKTVLVGGSYISSGKSTADDLIGAWNKIARGESLTVYEESAMKTLVHELIHNIQKANGLYTQGMSNFMETLTEYTARYTYKEVLDFLGAKAEHASLVTQGGGGYDIMVRRFARLMERLGMNDKRTADELVEMMRTTLVPAYSKKTMEIVEQRLGIEKRTIKSFNLQSIMDSIAGDYEGKKATVDTDIEEFSF